MRSWTNANSRCNRERVILRSIPRSALRTPNSPLRTPHSALRTMNLLLIGYRGTGKSTVARLVAERLGWPWLDADVELERRAGKTIAAIFAADGEPAFRDLESQVL